MGSCAGGRGAAPGCPSAPPLRRAALPGGLRGFGAPLCSARSERSRCVVAPSVGWEGKAQRLRRGTASWGGGGGTCGGAGSPFVVLNARTHPAAPRSVTLKSDEQFARGAPVRSLEGMAAVRRPLHAARQVGDEALHDLLQLLHEPRVGRQLASLRGEADRDLIHVVGFPVCCQKREVSGGRTGAHLPFTPVCFVAAIRALIRT